MIIEPPVWGAKMTAIQVLLLGAAGALVPDLLKFINGRFGDPPPWISKYYYWIAAGLLAVLGAVGAYVSEPQRAIDALAIGFAAPTIVASVLGKRPDPDKPELEQRRTSIDAIRAAWGAR
jgi:hypothetical protein